MTEDLESLIQRAIADTDTDGRSRGHALCRTKLEEALFWLREGRAAVQAVMHPGRPD